MEKLVKNKFPILKYHNKNGRHGLRENIVTVGGIFTTLADNGDPLSEE